MANYSIMLLSVILGLSSNSSSLFNVTPLPALIAEYLSLQKPVENDKLSRIIGDMGRATLFGQETPINMARAFVYLSMAAKLGDHDSQYYLYMMMNFNIDPLSYYNFKKVSVEHLTTSLRLSSDKSAYLSTCNTSQGRKILKSLLRGAHRHAVLDRLTLRLVIRERIKTMTAALYRSATQNNIRANLYLGNMFYDVG